MIALCGARRVCAGAIPHWAAIDRLSRVARSARRNRRCPMCAGRGANAARRDRDLARPCDEYWQRWLSRANTARRRGAVARKGTRTKCTRRMTVGTGPSAAFGAKFGAIAMNDFGLFLQYQHDGPPRRDDAERFEAGVEQECPGHRYPPPQPRVYRRRHSEPAFAAVMLAPLQVRDEVRGPGRNDVPVRGLEPEPEIFRFGNGRNGGVATIAAGRCAALGVLRPTRGVGELRACKNTAGPRVPTYGLTDSARQTYVHQPVTNSTGSRSRDGTRGTVAWVVAVAAGAIGPSLASFLRGPRRRT